MNIMELGQTGYVLALVGSAVGSALGAYAAGMGALGAWKRCWIEKRPAPYILVAFVGAPLSQTIYGMILMNALRSAEGTVAPLVLFTAGLLGGCAMGLTAWLQGKAGAAASDSLGGTGQGFGYDIMVLGIIETVALFVLVFLMTALK